MNVSESRDFPDWISPMLVKELRQGLKARAFEITFIVLQVVLVLVVSYHALLYAKFGAKFNPGGLNTIFWTIVSLQLLLVTPLRALNGLASERKANTLELIFMSGLSSWRIAWGKWASLVFQSLLFVLAVLPYAMLRYFFGGINLVDDLIGLGGILLWSAVLTAITLAVSGLPLFPRIGAIGVLLFGVPFLRAAVLFGPLFLSSGSASFGSNSKAVWCLMILDAVLIGLAALEFAASSISPVAENHALRQRLIVLGAWLPIPVLHVLNVDKDVIAPQWFFFGTAGLALSWIHLSATAPAMRVHLESFRRFGSGGFVLATLFQPGWHGAVLFLSVLLAFLGAFAFCAFDSATTVLQFITPIIMAAAALMTAPLIWRLFRLRPRYPLVHHTVFLVACGALLLFIKAVSEDRFYLSEYPLLSLLPPLGFFAMLDSSGSTEWGVWFSVSFVLFTVYALGLLLLSRGYWRGMLSQYRDIRKPAQTPPVAAEVAA